MYMPRGNLRSAFGALAWLTILGGSAAAEEVLYRTGFEAPEFRAGVLAGQGDFIAYQNSSVSAATIVSGFGRTGTQCARIDGSRLAILEGDHEGYYYPVFDYDPLAAGTPILDIGWDLFFTPVGALPGYAGVFAYDPQGSGYAGMNIHTDGLLHYGGSESAAIPIAFHQWHRFGMRLDFASRSAEFFLDGASLGASGFQSPTATRFGDADLYMETGPGSAPHLAYFDNYAITAVPEPGTIVLAAAGLLPLAGTLRRRRTGTPARTQGQKME